MNEQNTILIVDTQLEGHHVLWLAMVADALLEQNYTIIMLVSSNCDEVTRRLELITPNLTNKIKLIPSNLMKKYSLNEYWSQVLATFNTNKCSQILLNNFDTIASKQCRSALFGINPPRELLGKISLIYHRPRPLDPSQTGFLNLWKRLGWNKLVKYGWFKHIWLLDQHLVSNLLDSGMLNCSFIPDPWRVTVDQQCPREIGQLDGNQVYLLQYGVGDKRKGSELLLNALVKTTNSNLHIWIAGKQKDAEVIKLANKLVDQGRATLLNRYILDEEESWLFAHCNWVTLPYLSHYGSSNLLSKAAYYKKPVIASNFHLLGKNVINNSLGITFLDKNLESLVSVLDGLATDTQIIKSKEVQFFVENYSFASFKKALTQIFIKR